MTVVTIKLRRCIIAALCSNQDTDAQIESKESKVTIFYYCNISTNANRYILIFTIPFSFEQAPYKVILNALQYGKLMEMAYNDQSYF